MSVLAVSGAGIRLTNAAISCAKTATVAPRVRYTILSLTILPPTFPLHLEPVAAPRSTPDAVNTLDFLA